jgi:DNA-binding response OmpR family regulator
MTTKLKILVVDDEIAVTMTMVYLLTQAGFDAQAALSADKALRLAQVEAFDLITLDINMPSVNGFVLLQRLKEIPHLRETPVCFVSGRASIEDRQCALEMDAADFIEKPFDAKEFVRRLLVHVGRTDEASISD